MEKMSLEDRQIFYFDVRDIDWQHYFDVYIQGTRRFILKDDMNSLPEARKNLNRYMTHAYVLSKLKITLIINNCLFLQVVCGETTFPFVFDRPYNLRLFID